MFTRVVEVQTKPGKARDFSTTLNDRVLPILRKQPGFTDEITLISNTSPDHILAISFWDTEANAQRYHNEQFNTVTEILNPYLQTTPTVRTFNVDTSTTHHIAKGKAA